MKRTLVIDDRRLFDHTRDVDFCGEVVYARTLAEGRRELFSNGPWDVVYLDHDLGWGPTQPPEDIRPLVEEIAANPHQVLFEREDTDDDGRKLRWTPVFHSCSSSPRGRWWTVCTLREAGLTADEKEPHNRLHRF